MNDVTSTAALGLLALDHLQQVVAIDSASDECSEAVPSTIGQARLADFLAHFFTGLGAVVSRDAHANVVARFAGVGPGLARPPVALMVHLDTARGTRPVTTLDLARGWAGESLPYRRNPALQVSIENYPDLVAFAGHDVVFGPGDAPFGLDDKLGLTHLMTLARLMHDAPGRARPPVLLIGRPDEEIGRSDSLYGLARMLADEGVRVAYTVDGIWPFEINVENFNGAHGSLLFAARPSSDLRPYQVRVRLGGVNTHGATAKAEGHRAATRLACEVRARLSGVATVAAFGSDAERDCDGSLTLRVADAAGRAAVEAAVLSVVRPHVPRGASSSVGPLEPATGAADGAADAALAWIAGFLDSAPGWPLLAEDADGRDGYSHPYRMLDAADGVRVDVRIRDFTDAGLVARKDHLQALTPPGVALTLTDQYSNMGPALAGHPELVEWAERAAAAVGREAKVVPVRGGTGVDPFLEAGVPVANLGTGYFAPESEKELTSLQWMADHARWLVALLEIVATD